MGEAPASWRAPKGGPETKLVGGPFDGWLVRAFYRIGSFPSLEADGYHFAQHTYHPDGTWLESSTYVGFESDERIAEREAFWERSYWEDLAAKADHSFA